MVIAAVVTEIESYGADASGEPRRFEVASGTKISKGTVLKLTSPRTASASTGTGDFFAGIAAADKSATDYSTSIAAWENGIYEFTASGTIVAGDVVQTAAGGNYVITLVGGYSEASGQVVVGVAQKSVSATERVQVRVNN